MLDCSLSLTLHLINQQICPLHLQNISRIQPPLTLPLLRLSWSKPPSPLPGLLQGPGLASLLPLASAYFILYPIARSSSLGSDGTFSESPAWKPLFKARSLTLSPLFLLFYFFLSFALIRVRHIFACLLSLFTC